MEEVLNILYQIREVFRHNILFGMGILLISGFIFGKLAEKIKLPAITGYILAGLVVGPYVLGLIPHIYEIKEPFSEKILTIEKESNTYSEEALSKESKDEKEHKESKGNPLNNVSQVALGLVAITIGGEFSFHKLKKTGKTVIVLTVFQLMLAFGLVSLFLWLFKFDLIFSLLLGTIASATAPAATVAIIQSLNAKGPFVDYLYGIVALDDAGAVILFGIIFSVASSIIGSMNGLAVSAFSIVISSILEVVFSVLTGVIFGFILHQLISRGMKNINEVLIISLSIIFLSTAFSVILHLSPLLTNMLLGATVINLSERNERIFNYLYPLTPPIYAVFFAIAGTELDIMIFANVEILLFGIIFVVARAIGKYGGVYLGAALMKTNKETKNYLGLCMLPQAGVAIGLSLMLQSSQVMASNDFASGYISKVVSIVLFSVFTNEIIGPPLSKLAVIKGTGIEPNKNIKIKH